MTDYSAPQSQTESFGTQHQAGWWAHNWQRILVYVSFILFVIAIGLPFYYIFASSITPQDELFQIPPAFYPQNPTLDNYFRMVDSVPFFLYVRNSLIFAIGSSALSVVVSAMAAYALARIRFPGSNIIYVGLILSVALPQIAVLLPLFQTFQTFNLINTHHGLILLMSSLILPFTIMTFVSFIVQLPFEVEEAAMIDGASQIAVLVRVVFPLIRPAIATMFVINFIIGWNELLYPLVFAQRNATKTLSVGLVELSSDASTFTRPWDLMSAMSVLIVIPVLILILLGQRMIISGLARGAIK